MIAVRTLLAAALLLLVAFVAVTATPAAARPTEPGPTASGTEAPTERGTEAAAASSSAASEPAGAAAAKQANPVESLAGNVASGLADRALDSLFESIGEAAIWAFGKVLSWIDDTSSPDVTQRWFGETYARSYWLAATIALVALVWAITTAALRNGVTGVVGVLPRVLYVTLGLAVAVPLVQTLLEFTDWLSAQVAGQTSQNLSDMAGTLGKVLVGGVGVAGVAARSGGIPAMVVGFLALIILVGALVVWLELIFRSAAIYLLLAAAAFPAALSINKGSAKPIRKVAAWIVALAFAKPVIVLAFWVGSAPFATSGGADVAAVLTGAGTMTTAVFAPWALFKLFDFAGDQMTAAFAASASPERLRTHVEQPVTTYRRTATAVRERATLVRERGVEGFSPHRNRAASAAASGSSGATRGGAAAGGALVLAGSVAAASGAAASKRATRGMAATEPDGPVQTSAGMMSPTDATVAGEPHARPRSASSIPARPPRTAEVSFVPREQRGFRRDVPQLPQRSSPTSSAGGRDGGPPPAPVDQPRAAGPISRAASRGQREEPAEIEPRLPQRRPRPPVDPRGEAT